MNPFQIAALARMPARQLDLILGGVLAITAALLWSLVLRAPLALMRGQQEERARLERIDARPGDQQRELLELERQSQALAARLQPPGGRQDPQLLQLTLIGELDRVAARHDVRLAGATPGPLRMVARLREVPFEFEASGSYEGLQEWMEEVERAHANLAILRYDMRPAAVPGRLAMKIRMASYLLAGAAP